MLPVVVPDSVGKQNLAGQIEFGQKNLILAQAPGKYPRSRRKRVVFLGYRVMHFYLLSEEEVLLSVVR